MPLRLTRAMACLLVAMMGTAAHAAYRDTIQADSPLYYWTMTEASGTSLAATVGSTAITISGATVAQTGLIDGTAVSFDGSNDYGQTASALNLTAYNKIIVECIASWDAYANDDDLMLEFTANAGSANSNGFAVNPNASSPSGRFVAFCRGTSNINSASYTRPAAAAWHHYAFVFDMGAATNETNIYVDGQLLTAFSRPSNVNNSSNFANSTLNLFSRNGSTLFGSGKMQHLAIYSALSEARIQAHYQAAFTAQGPVAPAASDFWGNGYDGTGNPRQSSGAYVKFTTDHTAMKVYATTTIYGSFAAYSQVGWTKDGVKQTPLDLAANEQHMWTVDIGAGTKTIELITGLASSPSGTVLGTFLDAFSLEGGTTYTVTNPGTSSRVVVYGDSISVGANSTDPETDGWSRLLRTSYGRNVLVEGWGYRALADDIATTGTLDTTKSQALADRIAGYSPSLLVVTMGTNDYGLNKWSAANFGTALADFLDRFHTALPAVKVLLISPIQRISPVSETANGSGSTLGDYRTQESTIAGTRAWIEYHTGASAAIVTNGQIDSDGLHPTTAGHVAYAAVVTAWVEAYIPTAPTIGTATVDGTSQITIAWTDNSSAETGFAIEYGTAADFAGASSTTAAADATSKAVTGLSAGTLYYFRVKASGVAGDSEWSASASATTGAGGGGTTKTVCATGCDYTTIQAAYNAATSGDTIVVYPGTYTEGTHLNLSTAKNITIRGSTGNPADVTITSTGGDRVVYILVDGVTDTLKDLTISGTASAGRGQIEHRSYSSNLTCDNVVFAGNAGSAIANVLIGTGSASSGRQMTFTNCNMTSTGYCVQTNSGGGSISISGGTYSATSANSVVYVTGTWPTVSISGATITQNTAGAAASVRINSATVTTATVSGCTFSVPNSSSGISFESSTVTTATVGPTNTFAAGTSGVCVNPATTATITTLDVNGNSFTGPATGIATSINGTITNVAFRSNTTDTLRGIYYQTALTAAANNRVADNTFTNPCPSIYCTKTAGDFLIEGNTVTRTANYSSELLQLGMNFGDNAAPLGKVIFRNNTISSTNASATGHNVLLGVGTDRGMYYNNYSYSLTDYAWVIKGDSNCHTHNVFAGFNPMVIKEGKHNFVDHCTISSDAVGGASGGAIYENAIAAAGFTGATWTESTKTLTKTGYFALYPATPHNYDYIQITGGTNANLGYYKIASKTSDNAIVLATSIGATADGQTNIAGQTVMASEGNVVTNCIFYSSINVVPFLSGAHDYAAFKTYANDNVYFTTASSYIGTIRGTSCASIDDMKTAWAAKQSGPFAYCDSSSYRANPQLSSDYRIGILSGASGIQPLSGQSLGAWNDKGAYQRRSGSGGGIWVLPRP